MSPVETRLAILGSGPAGLSAALYAARAGLSPLVIEGATPGGQMVNTTLVENYPGFAAGVTGPDLVAAMRAQADKAGARFITGDVAAVSLANRPFTLAIEDRHIACQALIVASGARPRRLELPSEARLLGYGVSTCAVCDGFFCQGKPVLVIGGGDTALDDALYLATLAARVTIVHRGDAPRAAHALIERARANPKIDWAPATIVDEIHGEVGVHGVTGATLVDAKTGAVRHVEATGVFVAIGHEPNTALFAGQLALSDAGYVVVREPSTATSVAGVFAAGEVADPTYRQAITAAASGCKAAFDAVWYLTH